MSWGRPIDLIVVPPSAVGQDGAVATKNVTIGKRSQVADLRKAIAEAVGKLAYTDLVLYFQNESGPYSNRLRVLSDDFTLKENGVAAGATIVCQTAVMEKMKSKGAESLYYMWSQTQPAIAEDQRVQPDGDPKKLGQDKQEAVEGVVPLRKIANYSWVDDSRKLVKIYITSDEDPLALAAAGSEKDSHVEAEFKQQSLKITVKGKSATHVLEVEELEHGIVPDECKVKVSAGKKISVTLRKAKDDQFWHTLLLRK
uniref:CS domain-containing protein n=1 Tax=Alexandrium catenella TaxID=2925 RepID=A0A7S1MBQ9_ALECA